MLLPLLLFLLPSALSYNLTVLDAYIYADQVNAVTPNISIDSLNPYYGNISSFDTHNSGIEIPVYDLSGNIIRNINEVYVECYDTNDCDYTLTQRDINYLSLYASYIENSGYSNIGSQYALGLLRNKNYQNIMGMYTLDYQVLNNYIGFWIRLERYGGHVYHNLEDFERTVALLELAVHERSHHDAPSYNSASAHCDNFQINYNSLIQRAAKDLNKYNNLQYRVIETRYVGWYPFDVILYVISSFIIISVALQFLMY